MGQIFSVNLVDVAVAELKNGCWKTALTILSQTELFVFLWADDGPVSWLIELWLSPKPMQM